MYVFCTYSYVVGPQTAFALFLFLINKQYNRNNRFVYLYLPDGYFTFGYLPVPRNLTALIPSLILLLGRDMNPFYHTASIVEIEAYFVKPGKYGQCVRVSVVHIRGVNTLSKGECSVTDELRVTRCGRGFPG